MKKKKRIIIISSIVILILISIIVILSKYEYEGRNVKRVEKGCTYIIAATGEELKEGAKIPTPANGDIYKTEDYKYKYVSDFLKDEDGSSGIYYFTYSLEACYWHDVEDKLEMKCPLEGLSGWEHSTINKDKEKYEDIAGSIGGESIVQVSFKDCTKMKKPPKIPKAVVMLWDTYAGCKNLKESPKIPKGVEVLWNTYWGCENLTKSPKIPNGVIIMSGTFGECTKLKRMPNIPDSVRIMSGTFEGCTSLTKANKLPKDVISISDLFAECTSLEVAPDIPDGVYNMDGTFYKCANLKTVKRVPSSVRKMEWTFKGCTSLTGSIEIETQKANMWDVFAGVDFEKQGLTLTGDSPLVEKMLRHSEDYVH
ncbi:MAG: hypothetical protein E7252_10385 [Lachnospira sp.]|nr:hypothetical protein [Lachnospira sp.]